MACFFKTKGLELPFVQGLNANIASVRQMTAQWRHYAEDLATVRDIINHGGEHVFAVRNLYVASFAHCLFVTLWQVRRHHGVRRDDHGLRKTGRVRALAQRAEHRFPVSIYRIATSYRIATGTSRPPATVLCPTSSRAAKA